MYRDHCLFFEKNSQEISAKLVQTIFRNDSNIGDLLLHYAFDALFSIELQSFSWEDNARDNHLLNMSNAIFE